MLIGLATLICLCAAVASGKQVHGKTGKVDGAIVVRDVQGNPSSVPHAKVTLRGPANIETETDEDGNFCIASVPSGTYQVEAVAPGLAARQTIPDGRLNLKGTRNTGFFNSAWREYRGEFVLEF